MLKGRLGLETARVPQADRHGLLWLAKGRLYVEAGSLRFLTAGSPGMGAGDYAIPFQLVSCFLLQPGTTVSHDALRLLARHGCGLVFCGDDGARFYASMPAGPDSSARARRQVEIWASVERRIGVVLEMYSWRFGERPDVTDLNALRGIEGARVRRAYQNLAAQHGLPWRGRRYDRQDPARTNVVNMAINHATSALQGAAMVAVSVAGAIPQLGFIHEDSGVAFALDICDLFRESVALPAAFGAAKQILDGTATDPLENLVRRRVGSAVRQEAIVPTMIDRIKDLLDDDDDRRHSERG